MGAGGGLGTACGGGGGGAGAEFDVEAVMKVYPFKMETSKREGFSRITTGWIVALPKCWGKQQHFISKHWEQKLHLK